MIEVTLRVADVDRVVTVHEMTTLDNIRMSRMCDQIEKDYKAAIARKEEVDEDVYILKLMFYPPLKVSSSPNAPTFEEFLELPVKYSNEWYVAVDTLNPGALPQKETEPPTPEEVEAELEKKEPKPTT
jgi:hypothetical protein